MRNVTLVLFGQIVNKSRQAVPVNRSLNKNKKSLDLAGLPKTYEIVCLFTVPR